MFNQITLEYIPRFQIAANKAVYTVFVNISVLEKRLCFQNKTEEQLENNSLFLIVAC